MQDLNFEKERTYSDRVGTKYTFIEKRGNVTIFEDIEGAKHCRNGTGRYRWDNKDDNRDIVVGKNV